MKIWASALASALLTTLGVLAYLGLYAWRDLQDGQRFSAWLPLGWFSFPGTVLFLWLAAGLTLKVVVAATRRPAAVVIAATIVGVGLGLVVDAAMKMRTTWLVILSIDTAIAAVLASMSRWVDFRGASLDGRASFVFAIVPPSSSRYYRTPTDLRDAILQCLARALILGLGWWALTEVRQQASPPGPGIEIQSVDIPDWVLAVVLVAFSLLPLLRFALRPSSR